MKGQTQARACRAELEFFQPGIQLLPMVVMAQEHEGIEQEQEAALQHEAFSVTVEPVVVFQVVPPYFHQQKSSGDVSKIERAVDQEGLFELLLSLISIEQRPIRMFPVGSQHAHSRNAEVKDVPDGIHFVEVSGRARRLSAQYQSGADVSNSPSAERIHARPRNGRLLLLECGEIRGCLTVKKEWKEQ